MSRHKTPPEPWKSFLDSVDGMLTEAVELHCFGGFVVTHMFGLARTTNDIDFIGPGAQPVADATCRDR